MHLGITHRLYLFADVIVSFLESNPDQLNALEEAKDKFLITLLDAGLNKIPETDKEFASMTNNQFHDWLKKQDFKGSSQRFKFKQPALQQGTTKATKTLILPLSLENNSTITGTAAILEEFGKEFGIACMHSKVVLPYDEKLQAFDIDAARKHHDFLYLLQEHKKEMQQLEEQLTTIEKHLAESGEESNLDGEEDETENEETEEGSARSAAAKFQKIDSKFNKVMDRLTGRMWQARQSIDPAAAVQFKQYLQTNREMWESAKDHHGCSILHHAVTNGNHSLVQTLINAGVNLNVKERCGATPLTLAVIKGDEEMVKLLLKNFAICDDKYFTSVPGPKKIAEKQGLTAIKSLIENCLAKEAVLDIAVSEAVELTYKELGADTTCKTSDSTDAGSCNQKEQIREKTLVVGDQGTNKIIRSAKEKSTAAYGWASEVPGDMHARGKINMYIAGMLTDGYSKN